MNPPRSETSQGVRRRSERRVCTSTAAENAIKHKTQLILKYSINNKLEETELYLNFSHS
jgi:hypothetical protein